MADNSTEEGSGTANTVGAPMDPLPPLGGIALTSAAEK